MSGATTVQGYLEAKYSAGGPGSERFEPDAGEVHASQVSECQRKRWWKHDRGHRADPSPYFELGRVFEVLYGAALAYEHDPDVTVDVLKRFPPWEVAERSRWVRQDVRITLEYDGFDIVGEADWCVLNEPVSLQSVHIAGDGSRTEVVGSLNEREYRGTVAKVVETKTKKDIDWVRRKGPDKKHVYQVYPYVHALDCPGEIAYMQRNDWEELVVPVEYDEDLWTDVVIRARQHAHNMAGDTLPPTSPLDDDECHWCPFSKECRSIGGSAWD